MLDETMKSHLIDLGTFGVLNDDYETFFSQRIKAISDVLKSKIIIQPIDQVDRIASTSDPEAIKVIIAKLKKMKEKEQASSGKPGEIDDEGPVVAEVPTEQPEPTVESDLISVALNKSSGKYFIYLESYGDSNDEVINPIGKIIPFDTDLFEEPEEKALEDLISESLINDEQIKEYKKQKELKRYRDNIQQQKMLPLRGQNVVIDTTQTGKKIRTKTVFPRGCTVDGNHYESGNEAIDALLLSGKIRKGNLPTSSYNAHKWLQENYYEFGFMYKRDEN